MTLEVAWSRGSQEGDRARAQVFAWEFLSGFEVTLEYARAARIFSEIVKSP